jgi:hypothetical protein
VDYISKPFDPWVLRAKVSVFVELYVKNRQLREQAELLRSQLDKDAGKGAGKGAARRAIPALSSAPESADPAAATAEASDLAESTGPDGPDSDAADTGGAQPLLLELSGRLAAVEDLVGVLSAQPAIKSDHVLADCAAQLEHRVGRLRDALDALRVG